VLGTLGNAGSPVFGNTEGDFSGSGPATVGGGDVSAVDGAAAVEVVAATRSGVVVGVVTCTCTGLEFNPRSAAAPPPTVGVGNSGCGRCTPK